MPEASPKRDALRVQKETLKQQQTGAEQDLSRQHRSVLELELRKFRRHALLRLHLLEQELLREVKKNFIFTRFTSYCAHCHDN